MVDPDLRVGSERCRGHSRRSYTVVALLVLTNKRFEKNDDAFSSAWQFDRISLTILTFDQIWSRAGSSEKCPVREDVKCGSHYLFAPPNCYMVPSFSRNRFGDWWLARARLIDVKLPFVDKHNKGA